MTTFAVIGAGSWGTALAKCLADKGEKVRLWAYEHQVVQGITINHRNPLFLTDIPLPPRLEVTTDLEKTLTDATIVLSVVPSSFLRSVWKRAAPFLSQKTLVVSCTKGIESKTFKLMSQVLDECLPKHPQALRACLSGPTFARELALGHLTTAVVAGVHPATLKHLQQTLRTPTFLLFTSDDPIGIQVGGAVKNVIAIASGIGVGMNLGFNARAAIITRGLYEMIKVGMHLGAKPTTFSGLSGIGDLVLTSTGELSRNFTLGKALGEGQSITQVMKDSPMIAEGVETAHAVDAFAKSHGLSLPICSLIHRILEGTLTPQQALGEITTLPLDQELGSLPS